MKVLVSDALGDEGIKIFKNNKNIELDIKTGLSPEELKNIIKGYNALVIRSATKVTDDLLSAATNLKVVGRAGIGLDNVDIPSATKKGIVVMNTPTGNVVTTAEHTIAMMMSLSRNIPIGTATLKKGLWEKKRLQGREVFGKTIGVIGFGKIGAIVAELAKGLKMKILVFDPFLSENHILEKGFESADFDYICEKADYITIHVPKSNETSNMFNKHTFNKMKSSVMLINCARGGIINELDLYDAIVKGQVSGAALDVFEVEPPKGNKLLELDRIVCTPHLGASTLEAQTRVSTMIAEQIINYLTNKKIVNSVNF